MSLKWEDVGESVALVCGDCVEVMGGMPANSVDAIVCDPPYELGFMGKAWDASGIAYNVETWRQALRVLKPGGHLLAFGGTRTYHRMACAIEDAEFEVRDQIGWVYGSGFPKSHNGPWGGTALKPAWEPIIVARKPLTDTVADNVQRWGTGGLNIDACRVPAGDGVPKFTHRAEPSLNCYGDGKNGSNRTGEMDTATGRWPANLIHDGSDEVLACFPESKGAQGDVKGTEPSHTGDENTACYGEFGRVPSPKRGDSGSAARFFYCAKASKADREEGLEDAPDSVLARSCQAQAEAKRGNVVGEEAGAYNKARVRKNNHPTVKPTDLMRYLCRLVTPPGGVVLDPFMGSGSTGKAAVREGFCFVGIEKEECYYHIAKTRITAVCPCKALEGLEK